MNDRVRRYLAEKQHQAQVETMNYRNKVLLEEGLFEKEFPPHDEFDYSDYPYWDEETRQYYRPIPIAVTDEEFAQIEKHAKKHRTEDGGLFSDIGKKLMGLAMFLFWAGVVGAVIGGFFAANAAPEEEAVLTFLLTVVAGVAGSYITSWFLYGMGQLVDDTQRIREKVEKED